MALLLSETASVTSLDGRLFWAYFLGLLFLVFFAINTHHYYRLHMAKTRDEFNRVHSPSLIWGGIIGALALIIYPVPGSAYWVWVPFLIDPGSGYFLFDALNRTYFHIGGATEESYFSALDKRFSKPGK